MQSGDAMRITVLADSLSLPRGEEGNLVSWEETWPRLLYHRLKPQYDNLDIVNYGRRACTITDMLKHFRDAVTLIEPDIVIVQVGVVDCAPRVMPIPLRKMMNVPGFPKSLRKRVIKYRSDRRQAITQKDPLANVWTKPSQFDDSFWMLLSKLSEHYENDSSTRVIVLPVLGNMQQMNDKSPGFSDNVKQYNEMIRSRTESIGVATLCAPEPNEVGIPTRLEAAELYGPDGYHPNAAGNVVTANMVYDEIVKVV